MTLRFGGESNQLLRRVGQCVDSAHACCTRRKLLGGVAAAIGLGVPAVSREVSAQPISSSEKPFRIDVHHHVSSPGFIAEISGRRTGQAPLMKWTAAQSLEDMDKGGVATAILSVSEPSVFFGNYDSARKLARETNDFGARLIAEHPGRFGMFATVPLPDVEGSLREIEYALDSLKMDGICMMTDYQGKFLGDAAFRPVLEDSIGARPWSILTRSGMTAAATWCRTFRASHRAGHGYDPHHRKLVVQRLGRAVPQYQMDIFTCGWHGAIPDATLHLLLCCSQRPAATTAERTRLLSRAIQLRHGKCNDDPSTSVPDQAREAHADPVRNRFSLSYSPGYGGGTA